jgi:hypothetical protein
MTPKQHQREEETDHEHEQRKSHTNPRCLN